MKKSKLICLRIAAVMLSAVMLVMSTGCAKVTYDVLAEEEEVFRPVYALYHSIMFGNLEEYESAFAADYIQVMKETFDDFGKTEYSCEDYADRMRQYFATADEAIEFNYGGSSSCRLSIVSVNYSTASSLDAYWDMYATVYDLPVAKITKVANMVVGVRIAGYEKNVSMTLLKYDDNIWYLHPEMMFYGI